MKKLLAIVLTLAMTLTITPIGASAEEGGIQISFCVGEETLMINGEAITVEKPYVVGKGVTLVPLRVITEAFGAKVEWIEEIRTIKLEYPDVKITLQIDNPIAEVNGKAERLLSAPELKNGFTMVPLRFIAETLGAEVGYDDQSGQITVTKNKAEAGTMVEGGISKAYIGDSYYGWQMENSAKTPMEYRSFDGRMIHFGQGGASYFYIQISELDEDYDFENDFISTVEMNDYNILVKADKQEENGIKKYHIQSRTKRIFENIITYVTDQYIFNLYGQADNTRQDDKNELIRLMSTFEPVCTKENIYDFAKTDEEWHTFDAETINMSFEIPKSYSMLSSEDMETCYMFGSANPKESTEGFCVDVYSKSSVIGAKELAYEDLSNQKSIVNESICEFSEISEKEYASFDAYEYTYEIKRRYKSTFHKIIYFEKGEYVYIVLIATASERENKDEFISRIIDSIEVSEPDAGLLGPVLKNTLVREGTRKETLAGATITVPRTYYVPTEDNTSIMLAKSNTGASVKFSVIYADKAGATTAADYVRRREKDIREDENSSVLKSTYTSVIGSNIVTSMQWEEATEADTEEEKLLFYKGLYAVSRGSDIYVFEVSLDELYYNETARKEIKEIISSITFN